MKGPVTLAERRTSAWGPVIMLGLLGSAAPAKKPPVPVFGSVPVHAGVSYDSGTGQFLFELQITNPVESTLSVQSVLLDISSGGIALPVEVFGPTGWRVSNATADAKAMWFSLIDAVPLSPGTTLQGFGFRTTCLPAIRDLIVDPNVFPYIEALFADREAQGKLLDIPEQDEIQDRYVFRTRTLGPLGPSPGTFAHWDTWQSDIAKAKQLGWILDATLATAIETNAAAARKAVLAWDTATARVKLQTVVDLIQQSTSTQRTSEGYALVFFNAQYLRDHLPTPVPTPKK